MKVIRNQQFGFTLIEMIVSLGVFSVVITVSVGALLILIGTNEQLQKEQNVMTNLSFALDSMVREIRTGTHYFCDSRPNKSNEHSGGIDNMFNDSTDMDTEISDNKNDCENGRVDSQLQGISFKEGGNSITGTGERILYFYDPNEYKLFRKVSSQSAQSIVSSGIVITDMEFYVNGSEPLSSSVLEVDQSVVTIFIEAKDAKDANDSTVEPYRIQTTITQRTLDV